MPDLTPTSTQTISTIEKHILTQAQYTQLVSQGYVANHPYEEYYITDSNGILNDLDDVNISNVTGNQVLIYDSTSSKWINGTILFIPSITGNANKILSVNSGATGIEWVTNSGGGGGGLTNYDFTELSAPTISAGATTITFAANQRNGVEFSTNADLSIALISNNKSDNYIWITNSHNSNDIDVTFSSISFGATTINDVIGTESLPTIAHGETLEIGIYVTSEKARITSRIL